MKKLLFFIVLVNVYSCKKFLVETPESQLSAPTFYNSTADAISAVNAVYDKLGNSGIYHYGPTTNLFIPSANIYTTVERWVQYDNFTFLPSENEISNTYNQHYIGISRANAAINNIPKIDMEETLRSRLVAEAQFLRGLYYFNLVRLFGAVPLVLNNVPAGEIPERKPVAEVYAQIIADLEAAESELPDGYDGSNRGRATSGASKALQARVYLTLKNWEKAKSKAKEVIDSKKYELWDDYSQAFKEGANYGKENIFEVGFKSGLGNPTSGEGNILSYYTTPQNTSLPGSSVFVPTITFANSFEAGDRRREWGIYTSITLQGVTYTFEPRIFKYTSEKYFAGLESGWDASINFPLIRFAEIWLIYAEAVNEISGPVTEAQDAINMIRDRAQIDDIPADITQDAFREAVYKEREHELYMEGEDWFDLVRTNRLVSEHAKIGVTVDPRYNLFPIPQREIDASKGKIKQNDDY